MAYGGEIKLRVLGKEEEKGYSKLRFVCAIWDLRCCQITARGWGLEICRATNGFDFVGVFGYVLKLLVITLFFNFCVNFFFKFSNWLVYEFRKFQKFKNIC